MGYLINQSFYNISGIISFSEVNNIGTTPFVFNTNANFIPVGFNLASVNGSTIQNWADDIIVSTILNPRVLFQFEPPSVIDFYNFYGYLTALPNANNGARNIELGIANNFCLTTTSGSDPSPGDCDFKYNFYGFNA